jgi:excisionase family DNA binding protein
MKVILMDEAEIEALIQKVSAATLKAFREEIALDEDGKPRDSGGEFVDKRGAAKILKCSTGTVDGFARSGRLKKSFVGRSVRFLRSDVLAILDRKKAR